MKLWLRWLLFGLFVSLLPPAVMASEEGAFHFALAKMQAAEGNIREATRSFEKAIEVDPEAPFLRVEFAEFLYRFRRLKEAAEQIDEARRLAPDDVDVLRLYGQIYSTVASQDPAALELAEEAFETLRQRVPYDLTSMLLLGQLYSSQGRLADAAAVYEELVSYHPDNRQLSRLLVEALTAAGLKDRAQEVLEEVVRLDSKSLESRLELARIESNQGNHGTAIRLLESASAEIRDELSLRSLLAQEYYWRALSPGLEDEQRVQDLETALEMSSAILDEQSDDLSVLFLRAQVLVQLERFEQALTDLATVSEAAPTDPRVLLLRAQVLEQMQRPEDAAKVYSEAISALDDEGRLELADQVRRQLLGLHARREAWQQVAALAKELLARVDESQRMATVELYLEALLRAERGSEAAEFVKKELAKEKTPRLLLAQAEILVALERPAKALEVLNDELLEQAPEARVVWRRAELLIDLGKEERADEALSRLADQGTLEALMTVGQFHSFRSDFEKAIPFLDRALALEGVQQDEEIAVDLFFLRGQAYERSGGFDQAVASFRSLLEVDPENAQAMNYLGYMFADQGQNLDEALELILKAVGMEPENGAFVDSLGWAYYRLGRLVESQQYLEQAAELVPDDSTILEHLGDLYVAVGELDRAKDAYQRALQINDEENVDQVRSKLAELQQSGGS